MSKHKKKYALQPEPLERRKPTSEERQATIRLSRDLGRVVYRKRGYALKPSMLPPGRLNPTQAMQRAAQKRAGAIPTAKPFTAKVMDPVSVTPITCGIMADRSSSQKRVQKTVGVVRYVITEAVRRTHGTVAAVQFGANAYPLQGPNDRLDEIEVYDAPDGMENFVAGFSMLDAALNLIDGEGARVLFIITDGHWGHGESVDYAEEIMAICRQRNIGVVWVDSGAGFARDDTYGHGVLVETRGKSAIQVADELGQAIIDQFRKVAPQHSLRVA